MVIAIVCVVIAAASPRNRRRRIAQRDLIQAPVQRLGQGKVVPGRVDRRRAHGQTLRRRPRQLFVDR